MRGRRAARKTSRIFPAECAGCSRPSGCPCRRTDPSPFFRYPSVSFSGSAEAASKSCVSSVRSARRMSLAFCRTAEKSAEPPSAVSALSDQPFVSMDISPAAAEADEASPEPAPQAESVNSRARSRGNSRFFITDTSFHGLRGGEPPWFSLVTRLDEEGFGSVPGFFRFVNNSFAPI